jgi:hypothetical protein
MRPFETICFLTVLLIVHKPNNFFWKTYLKINLTALIQMGMLVVRNSPHARHSRFPGGAHEFAMMMNGRRRGESRDIGDNQHNLEDS